MYAPSCAVTPLGAAGVVYAQSSSLTAVCCSVLQAARVPIYAIKATGTANMVRALRTLLGVDPAAGEPAH